jgi:hypothetical protein
MNTVDQKNIDLFLRYPRTISEINKFLETVQHKDFIEQFLQKIHFTSITFRYEILMILYGIIYFPCYEVVKYLINYSNGRQIIDCCAGTGYLSYLLKKIDPSVKIRAFDNYQTKYTPNQKELNKFKIWHPVTPKSYFYFNRFIKDSVIVMAWPDCESNFAYNVAKKADKSNDILYIGEPYGGCTANDKFFENFELEPVNVPFYQYFGVHDHIYKVIR